MSYLTLAEEISARILNSPTKLIIKVNDTERVATLQELRDYLAPFGLDVTTVRALDWGISNPIQADHIDQICDLQQQVDDLSHVLAEKKQAAE